MELLSSLAVKITQADYTIVTREWNGSTAHADQFARLYLVEEGSGSVIWGEERRILREKRLYLIPSGTIYWHESSPGLGHYWVHFTADLLGALSVFSFFDCPFEVDPAAAEGPGLATARSLMQAACAVGDLRKRAAVEFLLSFFLRHPHAATAERFRAIERFSPATAFISDQLGRRIKSAEAAALVGMHPTYFANEFHRAFGMPPRRYILTKRIELAQRLLWTTDQPLKAIAAACGLQEPAYFSRVFRRITGVAPGAYRDLARRQRRG